MALWRQHVLLLFLQYAVEAAALLLVPNVMLVGVHMLTVVVLVVLVLLLLGVLLVVPVVPLATVTVLMPLMAVMGALPGPTVTPSNRCLLLAVVLSEVTGVTANMVLSSSAGLCTHTPRGLYD